MLGLLKRLLRPQRVGPPPILVRLRSAAGFVDGAVHLEATWRPSGRTVTTVARAAQGLCIIPWAGGKQVELYVVHASGRARLRVLADEAETGTARVVWLEAA